MSLNTPWHLHVMTDPSIPSASEAAAAFRLPAILSDRRLVLSHLGYMRRSTVRTDAYEIEAAFLEPDETIGLPLPYRFPFELLGMLRPGSIFENGVLTPAAMHDLSLDGRPSYDRWKCVR